MLINLQISVAIVGSDCQDRCWDFRRDFERIFGDGSYIERYYNKQTTNGEEDEEKGE